MVSKIVTFQSPCAQPEVTNPYMSGTLFPAKKTQRHCYIHPLRRKQDHTLYFLTHSSFVSHSLPYVFSNCLNLPFGTQGRSRRQRLASKKQGAGKDFCTWENSTGTCSTSITLLHWYSSTMRGTGVGQERE